MMSLNIFMQITLSILFRPLLISSSGSSSADTLTVQISDGEILGSQFVSSWTNKNIYSFLGIPYASPPIEDLRFKPPGLPEKWNDTKDCTNFRSPCMQSVLIDSCSEDCLFLNVYSPELNPEGALAPVYVWVHGGAFVYGTGAWYGPDKLVAEGVVVVTINYRLGAFGFLTLGTSEVPGNAALFDQVLALKWVQKEISKFGGDPNRVTLGGESAGSMMAHLHYLSPVSKGLFHALIAESGTSLRVAVTDKGTDYGLQLANLVNCSTSNLTVTQSCMKGLSADVILKAQFLIFPEPSEAMQSNSIPWVPTVDKDTNKDNPFLPATPAELMAQGQGSAVPFLMGTNRDEGEVMLSLGVSDKNLTDFATNEQFLIPPEILATLSNKTLQDKLEIIRKEYFGGEEPSWNTILGYLRLWGDYSFVYPTSKSASVFQHRAHVFLYSFEFDGSFRAHMTAGFDKQFNTSFVGHADELGYLFVLTLATTQSISDPSSREVVTWDRMTRLWTNFIKYRTPTPSPDSLLQNVTWTPVQNNSLHYLEISDNLTMVQSDYQAQVVEFWDNIFSTDTPSSASTLVANFFILTLLSVVLL